MWGSERALGLLTATAQRRGEEEATPAPPVLADNAQGGFGWRAAAPLLPSKPHRTFSTTLLGRSLSCCLNNVKELLYSQTGLKHLAALKKLGSLPTQPTYKHLEV